MEIYKLKKPVKFEGEYVKELELDMEGLAYKDLRNAERMADSIRSKKEQYNSAVKYFDDKYLACVAAVAAKVKVDMIFAFKAPDFVALTLAVRSFLLSGDWATDDTDETAETDAADGE